MEKVQWTFSAANGRSPGVARVALSAKPRVIAAPRLGTRPSLGGRLGGCGQRFILKPRTRIVRWGAASVRPPGGRVGRGLG